LISQSFIKEYSPGLSPGALCRTSQLRLTETESCF
jgi:hypothetical protein